MDELRAVMYACEHDYLERLRQAQNQNNLARYLQAFFDTMVLIYSANHYRGSPDSQYAVLPTESLEMLKSCLHDQQSARMVEDLRIIMKWFHMHNTDIRSVRNGFTALIWEEFPFHRGFGCSD